jgi:monoterpene epsilon-lactone hydrolase
VNALSLSQRRSQPKADRRIKVSPISALEVERLHTRLCTAAVLFVLSLPIVAFAQTTQPGATPPPGATTDTSVIDANGTAHITRVVPLPTTLSPQARKHMSIQVFDAPGPPTTAAQRRPGINAWQKGAGERSKAVYPVSITDSTMGGVPVRIIDPLPSQKIGPVSGAGSTGNPLHYSVIAASAPETAGASAIVPIYKNRVLICLHGGGFDSDTGSYTEAIPIANLTRTKVVSVLYRLSPENPYPAALDDAIAVYKTLLKTYKPADMAIFGTSAGAILTGEVAVRIKQLRLPEPAALGVFAGAGSFIGFGDSGVLFTLDGFDGHMDTPKPPKPGQHALGAYVGNADPHDPVLDPDSANLHGLPPTLFLSSSRDILLSATADMERAWLRDGVPSQMVVFDGLPHYFWGDVDLPESREAYAVMSNFFNQQLGR